MVVQNWEKQDEANGFETLKQFFHFPAKQFFMRAFLNNVIYTNARIRPIVNQIQKYTSHLIKRCYWLRKL